jgi:hypothetical protein
MKMKIHHKDFVKYSENNDKKEIYPIERSTRKIERSKTNHLCCHIKQLKSAARRTKEKLKKKLMKLKREYQ